MTAWLRRTTEAIDAEVVLRRYGAILGVLQALTGAAWFAYKGVAQLLTGDDAVCWPFLPACEAARAHLTPGAVRRVVALYMALGAAAAISFVTRRTRAAVFTLIAASLIGTAVYVLDYRLRFNQTYMLAWVVGTFLFTRGERKVEALSALLAAFYVAAGLLKLTPDWWTGRALYARPWLVPEALVPASCVYVIVLEVVLVWGLFSRRARVRRAVLAQLAIFHVVSWPVVGWFYPLEMLGLLSLFVLIERRHTDKGPPRPTLRGAGVVLVPFAAMQLVPALFRGDAALTGEGRMFTLHMFDARVSCTGGAIVRAAGDESRARTIPLTASGSDVRSECDPIVLVAHARSLCREPWARRADVVVDVAVDAKRATDPAMRPLVRAADVCRHPPAYSLVRENPWIVAR